MRLVIEREGGFTIVEDADAITEIDVLSDAAVLTIEVGGDKWTTSLPVKDHAEACRLSAAIAAKCGVLVEPLAEHPEDADDDEKFDEALAGAMAELTRKNTRSRTATPQAEWVAGEPPKDGRWYVVASGPFRHCVRWCHDQWKLWDGASWRLETSGWAHLPAPIPNRE